LRARRPAPALAPPLERDPAILASFLSDAAHVPGGSSPGIVFPRDEAEVAAIVAASDRVLAIGAQSSLTGGATPRGEVLVSTRALSAIGIPADGCVQVGAGVPLAVLQQVLTVSGLYYPPLPTYDGAFVGGTIATNAAGAATFKYGSTREWVDAITVVLASGDVLDLDRGEVFADSEGGFTIEASDGTAVRVRVPAIRMPEVAKLSAGYFAAPGMDLIDIFIGSEGTLGVITEARLRVVARPRRLAALVGCAGDAQAVALTVALCSESMGRRRPATAGQARIVDGGDGTGALDVSAVEYMDARSLDAVPDEAFARARVLRPGAGSVLLLIQIEVAGSEDATLEALQARLARAGVADDPIVALSGDDRGAERLFGLREAVPASVNALVGAAKARVHPDIQKTAADPVVPFGRLADSLRLYREAFTRRGLDCAIWGHFSDGNLHPNLIPRSLEDVEAGRQAILDIARGVIAMGGAPLAEHGVGRSRLKQQLLAELYGDRGIEEMRAVKRTLDPAGKLAPGVLFA
jgi:D-lactate dehydrogenase (cytochrome)